MGKKIYVIDTNILLESPNALFGFQDNRVVVTGTTIQEIDKKKTHSGDIGYHAREIGRLIEDLRKKGNLLEGVPLQNGGEFQIYPDKIHKLPLGFSSDSPDNRIISSTLNIMEEEKTRADVEKVVLVTNDAMMRVNASVCGICDVEFYRNDHISTDQEYRGWDSYQILNDQINFLYSNGWLPVENASFEENEFLHLTSGEKNALGIYQQKQIKLIQSDKIKPMGITAKNMKQKFALYALTAPVKEIPFVILKGPAGCAKTFLSLAAGLDNTYERIMKKWKTDKDGYKRVFISRNNVMSDADFGYLPGDLQEKMNPLMAPFLDNLENLFSSKCKEEDPDIISAQVEEVFDRGVVEVCPMAYMRGRSITNTYLIVDEAQNATRGQIRDVITRAGDGTKIVICGDPDQIDKHTLDKWNNGLVYAANKMKGSSLCAQLTFDSRDCVRSALAKEAVSRMS